MLEKTITIKKVDNGYIIEDSYYTTHTQVFKTFKEVVEFLRLYF